MFTGLIEEVGRVVGVTRRGDRSGSSGTVRLTLEAALLTPALGVGDSLAVDGVCLTAAASTPGSVELDVGPETLARTTMGTVAVGRRVNLERAMRLGDRLGGHLVQGHVDGVGEIVSAGARGEAWDVRVRVPSPLLRYVIEKGSICLDGISLTVNRLETDGLWVSLIPHSQGATTLRLRVAGDRVNVEVDLIGKYVERLLGPRTSQPSLSLETLAENGFV